MGTGVCFKCGSAEHSSTRCQRKNIRGYPYAVCFICKQQGHLSSSCDKNTNGIYPNGGSCNLCGSLYHLKKDCPELQLMKKEEPKWGCLLRTNDAVEGGDDDIIENEEKQKTKSMPLKTKKIIRF
ncbi:hypothetical protein AB6A40_010074 [Gnathostoma spinigerum]|uniref:CCHC-type domain-containing protein n=1 Tax=Gnathostoma spinigerum TaxID=75299 RepID=A0ABD6EV33_9BILA